MSRPPLTDQIYPQLDRRGTASSAPSGLMPR